MAEPRRIQRMRTKGWRMPQGAVYVGRPTAWGNAFRVGSTAWRPAPDCPETGRWDKTDRTPLTREAAVEAHRRSELWAMRDEDYAARLRTVLGGHDLACWCRPGEPCHADVLLELANPCFAVNRWNSQHPIGTMVRAYPGTRAGRSVVGPTRSPAWVLGAAPVVLVKGLSGGIALTHVDVVDQTELVAP